MIKKSIAVIISLVVVVALLPSRNHQTSINDNTQVSNSTAVNQKLMPDGTKKGILKETSEAQSALNLTREIELAATKSELEQLMLDYNDNLKNIDVKQKLETKMATLIEEYNAQALPIALEKIQKSNKSGS